MLGDKLLAKMWVTIFNEGIGKLLSPWQTRREGIALADVRRAEMLVIAQAEQDVQAIKSGKKKLLLNHTLVDIKPIINPKIEPSLNLHTLSTQLDQATFAANLQEEINIAKTILIAEEELANDPKAPTDENIDDDWLIRWRDSARKIKSKELQKLWAKALSGEIKSPGSHSLRTLEFIKNISQTEALLIEKLAPYVVQGAIFKDPRLETMGINFNFLLNMEELGIIKGVEIEGILKKIPSAVQGKYENNITIEGKALILTADDAKKSASLKCYKVTKIGMEVFNLGKFDTDLTYFENIGRSLKKQGLNVSIADCVLIEPEAKTAKLFNQREL